MMRTSVPIVAKTTSNSIPDRQQQHLQVESPGKRPLRGSCIE